ncbi:MAG: hypothetical protein HZA81_00630 [Candidatus Taylorbacteria bacterium]|nr:hypothetical protein [Candidatus Taylorbacteria bacterium]
MMNQWILFGGELSQKTVFKDRTYAKPYENPVAGQYGYVIGQNGQDVTLVYNGVYQVWHPIGLDLGPYRRVLESRGIASF